MWPRAARAQHPDGVRRIGVLAGLAEDDPEIQSRLASFRRGLERRGWSDRNVRIDIRFAAAKADRYQTLARELVAMRPDVILAHSTPVVAALQQESGAVPIVFVTVSDPIGSGFIASLARPGGNLTGVMMFEVGITGKWLALLKQIAPNLKRAAFIANPKTTVFDYFLRSASAIAPSLNIKLVPSHVETAADIERAIVAFAGEPGGGLILPPDLQQLAIAISSSSLPRAIGYRRSIRPATSSRLVASCPTELTRSIRFDWPRLRSTASSAATSLPFFRCRPLQSTRRP